MNRINFLNKMLQMATPVLDAASKGELRRTMHIEQKQGAEREKYSCFEAVTRLLNGIAPWLEADISDPAEKKQQDEFICKAHLAIKFQLDSSSDDYFNYENSSVFDQTLVDTAILAQGILRAPVALWGKLPQDTKNSVIKLMETARNIPPVPSNWLLFSTEIELLLRKTTGTFRADVISHYFKLLNSWYFGDGWYGDGFTFATDYYNSIIIHPMLLDLGDVVPDSAQILQRAQRHAEVLENLIAPDGTYIATGRSLAYRCGVFHLLAQLAWQKRLPASINPATARDVLYSITEKTLTAASYRDDGFLNIGIKGHDPNIGENYISTGSLYMAAMVFLPLGLSDNDKFWQLPSIPWTQRKIWEN